MAGRRQDAAGRVLGSAPRRRDQLLTTAEAPPPPPHRSRSRRRRRRRRRSPGDCEEEQDGGGGAVASAAGRVLDDDDDDGAEPTDFRDSVEWWRRRAGSDERYNECEVVQSIQSIAATLAAKVYDPPKMEDYGSKSPFELLNLLRLHQETCDGVLTTSDGGQFPIHRALLAVVSEYFNAMFLASVSRTASNASKVSADVFNKMAAAADEQQNAAAGALLPPSASSADPWAPAMAYYHVPGVAREHLALLLDYIYTSSCAMDEKNVEYLVPMANRFQVPRLKTACCEYLADSMTPSNALAVLRFAERKKLPDLRIVAKKFVLDNFLAVSAEQEFKELEFAQLEELLYDDSLNARSEELVFEAVLTWIDVHPRRRKRLLDLLHTVRFGQMSFTFFSEKVLKHELIADSNRLRAALYHPSVFLTEAETRRGFDIDLNDPVARPRVPYEVLFAVGGWSAGAPTNFIETYDARADRWFLTVCEEAPPSSYHGLVGLGGKLYMAGGFDGNTHFSSLRCYDPVTKKWEDRACMYYPRCYVSVCTLDGQIYAVGGYDGRTRMRSVERYTPETNQWELLAPMNRQRSDASACSARGRVYVAGGFNGQEVLNSVEFYDPKTAEWNYIRPMANPRSGVSLVNYRDALYVLGGFNGFVRMGSCERYDFDTGRWSDVADMTTARSNFAAAVLEDLVLVVGGFNGTTTISLVECYDITTNRWYDVAQMNINRSALAACVLKDLPNAKEFSYLSRAGVPSLTRIPRDPS